MQGLFERFLSVFLALKRGQKTHLFYLVTSFVLSP
jgi:hypothetical protein